MRHDPTAADLLETARQVLKDQILPALSGAARYDALMVANAMAIAARQVAAGAAPEAASAARLRALYGAGDEAATDALERRLCADLRAGAFDAPGREREAVFGHLLADATARAAESCPKALAGRPAAG